MEPTEAPAAERPRTSTRDPEELRARLATWLEKQHAGATISELHIPQSNGMSSETLLLTADLPGEGEIKAAARLAPDPAAVPVFPVYDFAKQFGVMRLVADRSSVPVPRTLWLEEDPAPLGVPFFLMQQVDGIVPPDVMPYTFGSWLKDASVEDQRKLQDETVEVIATLHAIGVDDDEAKFLEFPHAGDTHLRRMVAEQRAYCDWISAQDGLRVPLLDRAFDWLEAHWPKDEGPTVLSWGDARIGNIIYRDFLPVAVLDWEMVGLGPREVDLAWLIWMHKQFEEYAGMAGMTGMPHFLRAEDVVATYEELSGHTVHDLEWFLVFATLRYGLVMSRIARRQMLFGEMEMPADLDDLVANRGPLEKMLAGSYW